MSPKGHFCSIGLEDIYSTRIRITNKIRTLLEIGFLIEFEL